MRSSFPKPPSVPPLAGDAPVSKPPRTVIGEAIARGVALFIGGFTLLNLAMEFRHPLYQYYANLWWIDFRPMPAIVRWAALIPAAFLFIAYAAAPDMAPRRRRATRVVIELLGLLIAWNIIRYYSLLHAGAFRAGFPVPFSLFVFAGLGWVWKWVGDDSPVHRGAMALPWLGATLLACMVIFPVLQMVCFGKTTYRTKADTKADFVIVFGARVYADGRPSDALQDRVNRAVELYRAKQVARILVSGGDGEGGLNEADAMKKLAIAGGVRPEDIDTDRSGANTESTVLNSLSFIEHHPPEHPPVIMAVSHFYHLPRVKMCFAENGADVYTVPVEVPLNSTPQYMLREVPALWVYYMQALFQ